MKAVAMLELNADCLAAPTHHFGGLAFGNVASLTSKATLSHPKKAALQGLEKMKLLFDLGLPQLIFPPHPKPCYQALKNLGFEGSKSTIITQAYKKAPELLLMCSSSSAMWMANAATITPSTDSCDQKVHITPANLASNFHRSLEVPLSQKLLRAIFFDEKKFIHHPPLAAASEFFDEGAANHTRLWQKKSSQGLHLFVFGKSQNKKEKKAKKYPARQTKEAQSAISRLHLLDEAEVVFAQQNPHAIDQGVFHNDVVASGHENLYLFHEDAYANTQKVMEELQKKALKLFGKELMLVPIKRDDMPLQDAVRSYFFNSQIVTSNTKRILIAPIECKKIKTAKNCLEGLNCIDKVLFVPLNESMKNGGGPACLRLRIPLTSVEFKSIHQGVVFSMPLYEKLKQIIEKYYPDTLHLDDFLDGSFLQSAETATYEIYQALKLEHLL